MGFNIKKYPRTPHLEGSRLQTGDEDIAQISFEYIRGKRLVVEEKIDGANVAVSFDEDGTLLLQSRGHYLLGGSREVHYDLFKQWANVHREAFFKVLGTRYIMYGEWMYAKHSMYYDALPNYFIEFDIFDREKGVYLDTKSRQSLTALMPVCSVPVIKEGAFNSLEELLSCFQKSRYVSENHIETLNSYCEQNGLNIQDVLNTTDITEVMEGLYLKLEENGVVVDRLKYVRSSFAQASKEVSSSEWLKKRIIPNLLSVPLESIFEE